MPFDPLAFGLGAGGSGSWDTGSHFTPINTYARLGGNRAGGGRTGASTPTGAASTTSAYNLGKTSTGNVQSISDLVNSINRSAQTAANQARIPGATGLEAKSSANIGEELAGQVPADVTNLLAQQAAERGFGGGTPGGPNTNAAYLRLLGLTSIGQEKSGQQDLTGAYARNPAAPLFDPTTQILTPFQGAQLNLGYQTEADRAAEANRALDISAARGGGGGGGGGGYGYGGGGGGGVSPFQYGEPGMYSYTSPSTTTLSGGLPTLNPGTDTASWLASLGNYSTATDLSGGGGEGGAAFGPGGVNYSNTFGGGPNYSGLGTVLGGYM